ncbi:hypothetical protein GOP47_0022413 [Adiantum capillus-veneris]|uniref:Uncharacterized protein n=1 Tax=Adiantum capillus-veneris TaxID=13818 RepID=A0A9D4U7C7_ADICA|nr:hypothetical protein GOP47_0022413 [Adiantum capillus-veneris]
MKENVHIGITVKKRNHHESMGLSKVLIVSTSIRGIEETVREKKEMVKPTSWKMVNLERMVNFYRPFPHSLLQHCSCPSCLIGAVAALTKVISEAKSFKAAGGTDTGIFCWAFKSLLSSSTFN